MICANCNGSRWLIQPLVLDDGRNGIINLPCPVCSGTGIVTDEPADDFAKVKEHIEPAKPPRPVGRGARRAVPG